MRSLFRTIVTASVVAGISGCFSPGGLVIDLPGSRTSTDPSGGKLTDSASPTAESDSTSTATTGCDTCGSSTGGDSPTETTGGCSDDCTTSTVTETGGPSSTGDPSSTTCDFNCTPPGCGDGEVVAPEECDDGNANNNDDCSSSCVRPRRVFVTAATYQGGLNGLAGADAECQDSAKSAGLPGNFRAWLSDDQNSPVTRFDTSFTGAYQRLDKVPIAVGWDELSDGKLSAPISIDETGADVMVSKYAWTGTTTTGAPALQTCSSWTSAAMASVGAVGDILALDVAWTEADVRPCTGSWRLYCFEDP